jgi:hypothetical protein
LACRYSLELATGVSIAHSPDSCKSTQILL